jgi:hypothetical protein
MNSLNIEHRTSNVQRRSGKATALVLVVFVAFMSSSAAGRTWTDYTGDRKFDAEFVEFKNDRVHLKFPDGQQRSIGMAKLSDADQAFVRELLKEIGADDEPSDPGTSAKPKKNERPEKFWETETIEPAKYETRYFTVYTDVTVPEAKLLIQKLETAITNMAAYWGRPPKGKIKCFVIRDLKNWPLEALDPKGVRKISTEEGITLTSTWGRDVKIGDQKVFKVAKAEAVVYSCADIGIAQHESVHAYCGQTFGQTGPTWYSEGMAEMGQYWVKDSRAVNTPELVIDMFRGNKPFPPYQHKNAIEIVNEEQITGDNWENYTQRWALCHMLNHNLNYSKRFRTIGQGIVAGQKVNYRDLFGAKADQIEFEFKFFVEHIDIGYRVDLCSWDWSKRFAPIKVESAKTMKVFANRGWQPTGVTLERGKKYEYITDGTWKTGDGLAVSADGDDNGDGTLVAVILNGYELGESFALASSFTLTAPSSGDLYVRCQDDWNRIDDNSGSIQLKFKASAYATAGNNQP